MKKFDGMLAAAFISTIFYSAAYPYIHKVIVSTVSENVIAFNQIINCISVVFFGGLWNIFSDKLFRFYPAFCVGETVLGVASTLWAVTTRNITVYFIIDTMVFSIVTRNIICGGTKLRAIRYKTETAREQFDNNNNSANAIATIIGSVFAVVLKPDFTLMMWLATLGAAVDNIFYIAIYKKQIKERKRSKKGREL